VPVNSREDIISAAKELLLKMTEANSVKVEDIAAIFFTTTPDLNAEFPAVATRELGWPQYLALLCGHEMNVPNDLPRCLRILMLVNTEMAPEEIKHVYLGEAKSLRARAVSHTGGNE
jgi:chorismate mutase